VNTFITGDPLKSRDTARRLYPVKLRNVVNAIANAVDTPPNGIRIIEQPELGLF